MGEGTFAGTRGNDENAPIPDVRQGDGPAAPVDTSPILLPDAI
jgi:hypothetical protein